MASQHVKGHRDQGTSALTVHETLNILADSLANERRQRIQSGLPSYKLPNDQWSITIGTRRIGQHLETTLYTLCSKERMVNFWMKNRKWTNHTTFDKVDWEAILLAACCSKVLLYKPNQLYE